MVDWYKHFNERWVSLQLGYFFRKWVTQLWEKDSAPWNGPLGGLQKVGYSVQFFSLLIC